MATYKVIQDIEAEDKFLGPLTLKQFVFASFGVIFGWLTVFVARDAWFIGIIFAPISLFGFFMAVPWSKEQPTDIWVLAKIRFRLKPKARVWNQSGQQELVTITAPKKIEKVLTKDLSGSEVKSRLKALADTMDTRGWAIKHTSGGFTDQAGSDRLLATPVPIGSTPVLDDGTPDEFEDNQEIDHLINEKEKSHKQKIAETMQKARLAPEKASPVIEPDNSEELALARQLEARKKINNLATSRMPKIKSAPEELSVPNKVVANPSPKAKPRPQENQSTSAVTQESSPDIIKLAHNNDFDVATLARQANEDEDSSKEVVVSLH